MRTNTKTQGNIAEVAFLHYYISMGYFVSLPYGDNAPYDLVLDKGDGVLLKVQVKSRKRKNGSLLINLTSSNRNIKTPYTPKDFDILAVYDLLEKRFAELTWEDIGYLTDAISLRMEPSRNNQSIGVRLFEDYEVSC